MSYYTDACLQLDEKQVRRLKVALLMKDQEIKDFFYDLPVFENTTDDGIWTLYWENVRWCEKSSYVKFLRAFLIDIPPSEYRWMRTGELGDDVECEGELVSYPFPYIYSKIDMTFGENNENV